ncbi:putative heat shock protein Hsp88 [Myriangium duriaei CBS 260.36]|uniref:Heat shock protein Hsp88 n=1 Tax=Myriangium duriaei CBS 260.36 TaxID=1168546 RepID=A0A9P4MP22_9PEZI|nr:putative heat shock protein Hsp88 [Myriangium duriaei CBS 260.36]
MSVVGLDFGTQNAVIAVARNRGVDVITNEVSNRATPSLVGFGPKARYLGESAKTQEVSNLKNTVGSLTRLAGRSLSDPDVQIEREYVSAPLVDINGQVGAEVNYLGKKERFTATQLAAMFLTKARQTAQAELKLPVSDMVMAVPAWYTDAQRRSLLDAAQVAGLKILRLINETTATALGYGITKTDLPGPDEKPRRVAFVDIGHSNYTCSIVEFKKGELKVISTACDRHFGGRNFDKAIVDHFAAEFKEKFKIDINENPKARLRVAAACEKLKKVLSANASAPINIESLMNDVDVRGFLKREELEELVKPLLERSIKPLEQALAESKLKAEDIDVVELVGGCTRVPALKSAIQQFFGKTLSFTLNADEAIARGCAFSCAILSPVFRVRDFSIHDTVHYPIEFLWEKNQDIPDEDTSLTVFQRGNVMPSTKILTFYRKEPFDLEAQYAKPETLPGKVNPWIGRFSVKGIKSASAGDFVVCKLKARVNLHGVLSIEQGYYVEEEEVEEPVPEPKEGDAMDTDQANGDAKAPKMRKVKKQVRKGELPVSAGTSALDTSIVDRFTEQENTMMMEDKLVADTEDKKNELESFIYELRSKIDDVYSEFASDEEKSKVHAKLEQSEEWLYDEGDDATKAVYISKIEEIRATAGPIIQRYQDKIEAERQAAQKAQEEALAKKRADEEERRKAEEEKRKAEEAAKVPADQEMSDAPAEGEAVKPEGIDEA